MEIILSDDEKRLLRNDKFTAKEIMQQLEKKYKKTLEPDIQEVIEYLEIHQRPDGWEGTRYRGVCVYAMIESVNYHEVVTTEERGFSNSEIGRIVECDHEQQLWGWNLYDPIDEVVEDSYTAKELPTLRDVEKFIDSKLGEK